MIELLTACLISGDDGNVTITLNKNERIINAEIRPGIIPSQWLSDENVRAIQLPGGKPGKYRVIRRARRDKMISLTNATRKKLNAFANPSGILKNVVKNAAKKL
jgi:hypothetical protein